MKQLLFLTHDKLSDLYTAPVPYRTVEQAQRAFKVQFRQAFGSVDPDLAKDIDVFVVGEFDNENGFFRCYEKSKWTSVLFGSGDSAVDLEQSDPNP